MWKGRASEVGEESGRDGKVEWAGREKKVSKVEKESV